jgi:light-regulated signal transduction histidine kinase (bacteriophytochrome)
VVRDPERAPRYLVVQVKDANDRKLLEARLEAQRLELLRSNAELESFASVASHDLQEPLRKIRSFGDRLKDRCRHELSEEGQRYVDFMTDAAERMQQLILDLLVYSRISAGGLAAVRVSLGQVAEAVARDLETRLSDSGGRIEIGALPEIDADPTQMRQLLQNLIANALKFRRPGVPPVVTLSAEPLREGRSARGKPARYRLSVADNGIGFEERYLDRIFTPFEQLHGRAEYEGTGMGLAICRKIAERHGGTITARSTPGAGSCFIVTLPVTLSREEAAV